MPKPRSIVIATRKSALALWQARYIAKRLEAIHTGLTVRLLTLSTQGDRFLETRLDKIGGKGLFVKELEHALLDKRADLAVHSMKDVPVTLPEGLCLPVICKRADPRDALIMRAKQPLDPLPKQLLIGTSSLRRQTQLKARFPDWEMAMLRGNVNTRLEKLDQGLFQGIVLAASGLIRLGFSDRMSYIFPPEEMLPAAGQGALGIECRCDDSAAHEWIASLNDNETQQCVSAERAMNIALGGNCHTPIAAYAQLNNQQLHLRGVVGSPKGTPLLSAEATLPVEQAETLGRAVAEQLKQQGAEALL